MITTIILIVIIYLLNIRMSLLSITIIIHKNDVLELKHNVRVLELDKGVIGKPSGLKG